MVGAALDDLTDNGAGVDVTLTFPPPAEKVHRKKSLSDRTSLVDRDTCDADRDAERENKNADGEANKNVRKDSVRCVTSSESVSMGECVVRVPHTVADCCVFLSRYCACTPGMQRDDHTLYRLQYHHTTITPLLSRYHTLLSYHVLLYILNYHTITPPSFLYYHFPFSPLIPVHRTCTTAFIRSSIKN